MDELLANDERLKQLFQAEGRLMTSPGFTDRVMERVESIASPKPEYKPLISRRVWFLIAAAFTLLVAGSWLVSGTDSQVDSQYTKVIEPIVSFFKGLEFNPDIPTESLIIITVVVGSISLLLAIDYFLNNKPRNLIKG